MIRGRMYRIFALLLLLLTLPYVAVISNVGISHAYADSDGDSGGDSGGDSDSDGGSGDSDSEGGAGSSGDSEGNDEDHDDDSADDDGNQERSKNRGLKTSKGKSGRSHQKSIRKAVQRNQILPLNKIKRRIAKYTKSEIISIELEHKRFGWVYEFKIIDRKGRLLEVYMNATTGKVIKSKNRGKRGK